MKRFVLPVLIAVLVGCSKTTTPPPPPTPAPPPVATPDTRIPCSQLPKGAPPVDCNPNK